jgi:chromosome segregation ATPase
MNNKRSRWMVAIAAIVISAALLLAAAAPALAQGAQDTQGQSGIPEEVQGKRKELREGIAGLREEMKQLQSDAKEFKRGMWNLILKARSLSLEQRQDLKSRASAIRDEYRTEVQEKLQAIKENAGGLREAMAAIREAWQAGDTDTAVAMADEALAEIDELKGQLEDLQGLSKEILEQQQQLLEEIASASGSPGTSVQGEAI